MLTAVPNYGMREVGEEMPDRRESSWSDPRVLIAAIGIFLQFVSLCMTLLIVVVGAWVVMSTRGATTEMSNSQLAQQITILSGKVDKLSETLTNSTQQSAKDMAALQSEQATLRRDLDREVSDRAGGDKWLEARIVSGK